MSETTNQTTTARSVLGMPALAVIALAALGVPRVIMHDLHMIPTRGLIPALLALAPVVIWIIVTVALQVPRPFVSVLVIGAVFGLMLVITHQVLWSANFGSSAPEIWGSTLVPRLFAVPSGLFTGTIMGALGGLIAWAISALRSRR